MDIEQAIDAWRNAILPANVETDITAREKVQTATFQTYQQVPAILRPGNRDEVQRCIEIANQFKAPLHPVSAGKNWGYGSSVPSRDQTSVLDLSRLDSIINHDEELGVVTLEPGVTFRQLHQYLQRKESRLLVSSPGSTADASVIGNALERGVLQGPEAERYQQVAGLEVILANGQLLQPGFGRFGNAVSSMYSSAAPGPQLDGLFFQSGFGVVTSMSIWLEEKPAHSSFFSFAIDSASSFEPVISALKQARKSDILSSACSLFNSYRVLAYLQQYPWQQYPWDSLASTPLTDEAHAELKRGHQLANWMGIGSLAAASHKELRGKQDTLLNLLKDHTDRLEFRVNDDANVFFNSTLDTGASAAYWRKQTPPPEQQQIDPDRDACGVIWYASIIPLDETVISKTLSLLESILLQHGFEPAISIVASAKRSVHLMASILFDRALPGQDEAAAACYRKLVEQLSVHGVYPCRLPQGDVSHLPAVSSGYVDTLCELRKVFDPNQILSPGRYQYGC
jgi:4-cresol dehydrogenase (hydroxylating)